MARFKSNSSSVRFCGLASTLPVLLRKSPTAQHCSEFSLNIDIHHTKAQNSIVLVINKETSLHDIMKGFRTPTHVQKTLLIYRKLRLLEMRTNLENGISFCVKITTLRTKRVVVILVILLLYRNVFCNKF